LVLILTLAFGICMPRTLPPRDRAAVTAIPLAAPTKAAPPAINGIFALLAALVVAWPAFSPASPTVSRIALTPFAMPLALAPPSRERFPELDRLGEFLAVLFRFFVVDRFAVVGRRLAAAFFAASDRDVFVAAIRHLAFVRKNPVKVPEPSYFPLFEAINNPGRLSRGGRRRGALSVARRSAAELLPDSDREGEGAGAGKDPESGGADPGPKKGDRDEGRDDQQRSGLEDQ
jgi:hypothetical protein